MRDELDVEIANFRLTQDGDKKFLADGRGPQDREYCHLLADAMFGARLNADVLVYTPSSARLINRESARVQPPRRNFPDKPHKRFKITGFRGDFYLTKFDHHASLNAIAFVTETGLCTGCRDSAIACAIPGKSPTSVGWRSTDHKLAVGCEDGSAILYDAEARKPVSVSNLVHESRIGKILWRDNLIATASRDSKIAMSDARTLTRSYLHGHGMEVCGLALSDDSMMLATGGNDNIVVIWDMRNGVKPLRVFKEHTAGVKAIAWKPRSNRILVTGGGMNDGCIHMWEAETETVLHSVSTDAQVTSLHWPAHSPGEILSTHGYGADKLCVWSCKRMHKLASLSDPSSTERILDAALADDQQTFMTLSEHGIMNNWHTWPSRISSLETHLMRTIR